LAGEPVLVLGDDVDDLELAEDQVADFGRCVRVD
jgi:hypothetical protein